MSSEECPDATRAIICEIFPRMERNEGKTLIYVSFGCAFCPSIIATNQIDENLSTNFNKKRHKLLKEARTRAKEQQLPPFIKHFMKKNQDVSVISVLIDPKLEDVPCVLNNSQVYESLCSPFSLAPNVKCFTEINGIKVPNLTVITMKENVQWSPIRRYSASNLRDIRKFISTLAQKCVETKCCMIVESFTGNTLHDLRQYVYGKFGIRGMKKVCSEKETKCAEELLNRNLIGLTVLGETCHPNLHSKEYQINITCHPERGIIIPNPHWIITDPKLYRSVMENALRKNDLIHIRLSKLHKLYIEILCESLLSLARMTIIHAQDDMAITPTAYRNVKNYTEDAYDTRLKNDVDSVCDLLMVEINYLQKYAYIKHKFEHQLKINAGSGGGGGGEGRGRSATSVKIKDTTNPPSKLITIVDIENFKKSSDPTKSFLELKKRIMAFSSI